MYSSSLALIAEFLLRNRHRMSKNRSPRSISPPTIPPAIAPILLLVCDGGASKFWQHASVPVRALHGVFQNCERWRFSGKFANQTCRSGQVENVVVRKFFAVKLLEIFLKIALKRRLLMWVFAIAQRLRFWRENVERFRHAFFFRWTELFSQEFCNRSVVC